MKAKEFRKLTTATLADALKGIGVGETCIAPDNYSPYNIKVECTRLRKIGFEFVTSRRLGVQTITRLR